MDLSAVVTGMTLAERFSLERNHYDRLIHFFLAWRLCVYAVTGYGWWWMRKRVLRREPSTESRSRLRRTEIAAVFMGLILEGTVLLQSR